MSKDFVSGWYENPWLTGGAGALPSNALVVDAVTGLVETYDNTTLVDAAVEDVTALLALNTTTYDGLSVVVRNPGGNPGYGYGTVAGIPARAYCDNGAWHWESGILIHGIYAEALQLICPAATFTSPAVSNSGGLVKLTSAGAHGLTTANAITTQSKVRVLSGTNWVAGDYNVTAITLDTTGTDFTIDYTYSAGLGVPTLALVDASAEREIVRIKIPKSFTTRAKIEVLSTFRTVVAAATATIFKVYSVASGAAYTTASNPFGAYTFTAAANICNSSAGLIMLNSRSAQRSHFLTTSASGAGTNATDSTAFTLNMDAVTDIVVTALIQTADRPLRIDNVTVRGYDA
jgi:hypothetical protein